MADGADFRARFTAEGVEDILAALARIEKQSAQTGANAAKGISLINDALAGVKGLLPRLTFAAAVAELTHLAVHSIEAANNIGDLSQATGASAETLSLFSLAAKETGTPIEILTRNIPSLAKALDALKNGDKPTVEAFKRIGLSAKDFQGLNFDESLKKIAVTMGGFEDSEGKAAVAMQLFGKNGAMLIPVLDQLATEGLPNVEARAKKLGVLFSEDMVSAADAATKAWADMSSKTQGSINQLIIGGVPQLTEALDHLNKSAEIDGASGWGYLGVFIGSTLNAAAKSVSFVTLMVKGFFNEIIEMGTLASRTVTGLFGGERKTYLNGLVNLPAGFNLGTIKKELAASAARSKERNDKLLDDLAALDGPAPAAAPSATTKTGSKGKVGSKGDTNAEEARKKLEDQLEKARTEALIKGETDRIKLTNEWAKQQEAALKSDHEKKLITDEEYFAGRRALLEQAAADEIQINNDKIRIIETEMAKKQAEINKLSIVPKGEAAVDKEKRQGDIIKAQTDMTKLGAELNSLQVENQLRAMGVKTAKDAQEIEQKKFNLTERQKDAELALKNLDTDKAAIQQKVLTGELLASQAEDQVNALEKERLPLLVKLGAEMAAQAELAKDDTAIQKAKEYNAELDKRAAKLSIETDEWAKLKKGIQDTAHDSSVNNLTNALMDVTNGTKSVTAAFHEMANAILQDIQRIVMNRMANNIVDAGFNAIGSWGGGTASSTPSAPIGGYTPTPITDYTAVSKGIQTPAIRTFTPSVAAAAANGGSGGMGNMAINIQNNSSQPVSAKSSGMTFDGKQAVINIWLEDFDNGGPTRARVKGGNR